MTEAELAELRHKLIGKLARLTHNGRPYGEHTGIIDRVERSDVAGYTHTIHFAGRPTHEYWYLGHRGWGVELYKHRE